MQLRDGKGKDVIDANIAELIRTGHPRDQAVSIAYDHAQRQHRFDAAPGPHATMIVNALAHAQQMGIAKRRRPVAKPIYPHALEASFATKLVALVHRATAAYDRLKVEMPRLLARAQVSRGDDDTAAPSAPDLTALRTFRDAMQTRTFAGFPIVIENDIGSTRSWVDRTGNVGRTTMLAPYGYIDGAIGADGDEVDVYLGPDENAAWVYVVHQHAPPDFVAYDEDKVMLGYPSSAAAERAYLAQYTDPRFFGGMSQMSVADFRAALETSDGAAITHRLDSGELDFAKQLIDEAGKNMRRELTPEEIEKLARFFSREASQAQRRDLARQLSAALGIDVVPDEKYIPEVLDYFVHENATLIGSIPEDLHREVANLTARAFTKRMDPEIYGKLIQDRFNVAENRARFIARDQLGKLWGQLNAVRQRGVGVQHFFWETRRDSLVRPSHRALQGHRISYDEPPAVGLPGEDFGCRCGARPDVSNIVAAAASLRTSAGGHAAPIYGG